MNHQSSETYPSPQGIYSSSLLRFDQVSLSFGAVCAVQDLSLSIPEGILFGLVGSDGAGKSTLLRLAATMITPTQGTILLAGLNVAKDKDRVKSLIGYMPQRFGLYQDLTVDENMTFFMDIFHVERAERRRRRERYLSFSHLLPFADRLAGNLSGGMKQKLGLACVLVHQPRILILDEPTNGVDPVSRQEFWEILAEMRRKGITIVVSTTYLDEAERCDLVGLMHQARLHAVASPAAFRSHYPTLEDAVIARLEEIDQELARDAFKR